MTVLTNESRVNLGCGRFPLEGYLNVDQHELGDAILNRDVWNVRFENLMEVRMDHFLEHFGHRQTVPLLRRIRGWLASGGLLRVEVPDMEKIMDGWRSNPDWLRYLYGSQQHDGEFHKTGFTRLMLLVAIQEAGFKKPSVAQYESNWPTRPGMPCLKAVAYA